MPHDHDIAVIDERVHHRIAAHLERVNALGVADHVTRQADHLGIRKHGVGIGNRKWQASRNGTEDGNGDKLAIQILADRAGGSVVCGPTHQPQTTRDLAVAREVALVLQRREVVAHHRGGRDVHCLPDLANRRWVSVLGDKVPDHLQDLVLPRR